MKKNYVAIALCLVCAIFTSCIDKDQKAAEEYLKNMMKSPSSFKVISVDLTEMEPSSSYDTLYHISKVYDHYFYSIHEFDSVAIDSIRIMRRDYPAYKNYFIEYDAANSYGAIIRDSEFVIVYEGEACSLTDFIAKFSDKEVLDHTEAYKVTIVPRYPLEKDMKVGNWLSKIYMGIY